MTTSSCVQLQVTTSDYEWLQLSLSQTTSDYEWVQVTTSDCKGLQVTTSDYEPVYEWLQLTRNDWKWLPVKLRMTRTGIGNNLRHKNVYCFLWLHSNEWSKYVENCSKNSFATPLVKIIEKYLQCRSSRSQMFFKVSVLKKAFNPSILLKRDSNTRVFLWNLRNF